MSLIFNCLYFLMKNYQCTNLFSVNCPEGHRYLSDPKIRDGCYKVVCQKQAYGGDYILP